MDDRQQVIIDEVKGLFKRYGIKSVSMDDIAVSLGMSKKTLYQYFPEKESLIERVVESELANKKQKFEHYLKNNKNAIEEAFNINRFINDVYKDHIPAMIYDLKKYYPAIY